MNQLTSSTRYDHFVRHAFVMLAALYSATALNTSALGASAAFADVTSPQASLPEAPPTIQIPYVASPPRLGLDDAIWNKGTLIPRLSMAIGGDASLKPIETSVRLLWSQNGLYLRFNCTDNTFFAPEKGRDAPIWKGDVVEVFLDAKGDARQWIELETSPRGDMFDQLATLTTEPESNEQHVLLSRVLDRDWWTNLSWNLEGWQTRAVRTSPKRGNWRVDMMIPPSALQRLGMSEFAPMTLRLNLIRYKYLPALYAKTDARTRADAKTDAKAPRRLLAMNWAPVQFGCPHISPQAMGFARLMPPNPTSK